MCLIIVDLNRMISSSNLPIYTRREKAARLGLAHLVTDLHERVFSLQDELSGGILVIEDGEARRLTAAAALKSYEETLAECNDLRKSAC